MVRPYPSSGSAGENGHGGNTSADGGDDEAAVVAAAAAAPKAKSVRHQVERSAASGYRT